MWSYRVNINDIDPDNVVALKMVSVSVDDNLQVYSSFIWEEVYRSFGGFRFLLLIAPVRVSDGVGFCRVSSVGLVSVGVVPIYDVFRILVGCRWGSVVGVVVVVTVVVAIAVVVICVSVFVSELSTR